MIGLFSKKEKNGLLTLFIDAAKADADKIGSMKRSQVAKEFKTLEEPGVDDEMISWIGTILEDRIHNPAFVARERILVNAESSRWLFSLPSAFVQRLAGVTQRDAKQVARTCSQVEEPSFEGWDEKSLSAMVLRLAEFAKTCGPEGILVLIDVSKVSKKAALDFTVKQLIFFGDSCVETGNLEEAIGHFTEARALVQKTKYSSSWSSRVLQSLGQAYFVSSRYQESIDMFIVAMDCLPEGESQAELYHALAAAYLEAERPGMAEDYFAEAYMSQGLSAFKSFDLKYLEFLLSTVSELGRRADGWNDALLLLDLHLKRELGDRPIVDELRKLCIQADSLARKGELAQAIQEYENARELVADHILEHGYEDEDDYDDDEGPDRSESHSALWIRAAIGDVYFRNKQYEEGREALHGFFLHPFSYWRIGQCYFELGDDMERAVDYMARAYMLAGSEIFKGEDPKYAKYLSTILKPPAGQTEL